MTARTPISYLLEVCSRRGITPQYDLIATEGRVHEPTFVFRCTAGPYSFTGKGTNKKIARHEAAHGVLQQMIASERSGDHPEIEIPSVPTAEDEDPDMQNPVGKLQEIAQKNHWMPPTYEYETDPESKEFVCIVAMAKMEERGQGRSKKAAKKTAAKNLLKSVLDNPDVTDAIKPAEEEEEDIPLGTESVVIPPSRGTQAEEDAQLLEDIQEPHMVGLRLKNPKGVAVDTLKSSDLDPDLDQDFVDQLRILAEEQNWIIQYHELPSPSADQFLMLVEVSKIKPHVAVYHGAGQTQESCKNRAARNMLDYIKKMILTDDQREA